MNDYYKNLCNLKYFGIVEFLKHKYGTPDSPYFLKENCRSVNNSIKRYKEGLFIHHTYEYMYPDLSKKDNPAVLLNFEFQKDLVYCNYLEHLILHLSIVKEFAIRRYNEAKIIVGVGGIINHIVPTINDLFLGYEAKRDGEIKAFELIKDNLNDYKEILQLIFDLSTSDKVNKKFPENSLRYIFFQCFWHTRTKLGKRMPIFRPQIELNKGKMMNKKTLGISFKKHSVQGLILE